MTLAPIFILSNPRAGSTLLRYLLDAHPDISSPAELQLGMVCRVLLGLLESTQGPVDTRREVRTSRANRFAEVAGIINKVMEEHCRNKDKLRWCEKSPHNIDHLDVLNCVFPDSQCICLHRHGLDAVKSWVESGLSGAPAPSESGASTTGALTAAVQGWCRRTERLLAFETTFQSRCLRVRYEDLVTAPTDILARIASFLEIRAVPNLHHLAFSLPHDMGPGDPKINWTSAVETSQIGQGRQLHLEDVPPRLRNRLTGLLETLGY